MKIEAFVDPSCPWAFITTMWLLEVAPHRDLELELRSFCLEIRDDYGVAPTIAENRREAVIAAHALSHRMLRIMEAAKAGHGAGVVEPLLMAWGPRFFPRGANRDESILAACLTDCGLDADLLAAADDEKWDVPIVEATELAYEYGGHKTQTPTILVHDDPPHGFKGPVMAPAPTGDAALRLWDALLVLSREPGFFEFTRPRVNRPRPAVESL